MRPLPLSLMCCSEEKKIARLTHENTYAHGQYFLHRNIPFDHKSEVIRTDRKIIRQYRTGWQVRTTDTNSYADCQKQRLHAFNLHSPRQSVRPFDPDPHDS